MSHGLAASWWFWVLAGAVIVASVAFRGAYRLLVTRARRAALQRGLIELPPGRALREPEPGFSFDLSWAAFPVAGWVVLGPWIWGYDDVEGAIATDVLTGSAVIALALVGTLFPALWALNLGAGLWLVLAPWLVGYGDSNGPVGISDSVAGVVIAAASIAALASAERQLGPGGAGAIGRIRPRE